MREPLHRSFANQVHRVIEMDIRRASSGVGDARVPSNTAEREAQVALQVLATSLRGTHRRGGPTERGDGEGRESA
jgi:hypothetical protein